MAEVINTQRKGSVPTGSIAIRPGEELKTLEGKPVKFNEKELTLGDALAYSLIGRNKAPDPLRAYLLAQRLSKEREEMILDASELTFLREAIQATDYFNTLVVGQVLEKLTAK